MRDKRNRKILMRNRLKTKWYNLRIWWLESCAAEAIREVIGDFFAAFGFVCFLLMLIAFFY